MCGNIRLCYFSYLKWSRHYYHRMAAARPMWPGAMCTCTVKRDPDVTEIATKSFSLPPSIANRPIVSLNPPTGKGMLTSGSFVTVKGGRLPPQYANVFPIPQADGAPVHVDYDSEDDDNPHRDNRNAAQFQRAAPRRQDAPAEPARPARQALIYDSPEGREFWKIIAGIEPKDDRLERDEVDQKINLLLAKPGMDNLRKIFIAQYLLYFNQLRDRILKDGFLKADTRRHLDMDTVVSHVISLGWQVYETIRTDMGFLANVVDTTECHSLHILLDEGLRNGVGKPTQPKK